MIRPFAAALLIAALAGPTLARPLKPEQEALIRPDGKPVTCVSLHSIRETRVRDDRTIDLGPIYVLDPI